MEELVEIMTDIRTLMLGIYEKVDNINDKLDDIKGQGIYNSISDVCGKLDDIQGIGLSASLYDVKSKLDESDISLGGVYDLRDVCDKLDNIESALLLKQEDSHDRLHTKMAQGAWYIQQNQAFDYCRRQCSGCVPVSDGGQCVEGKHPALAGVPSLLF